MTRAAPLTPRGPLWITLAQIAALLPPVAVVWLRDPSGQGALLAVALAAAILWDLVFARLRHRGLSLQGLPAAFVVAVLVPPDLAAWQVFVVMSLGVILADLAFGGRGFGFVGPAVVALSLLLISFPSVQLPPPTPNFALATLPGFAGLLLAGLISGRVALAMGLGAAATLALQGQGADPATLLTALAFGGTFLVCDPTSAAVTGPGRWIFGALAGALIVVFAGGDLLRSDTMVYAVFLAALFAPLIDHLVILAQAHRRRRQQLG